MSFFIWWMGLEEDGFAKQGKQVSGGHLFSTGESPFISRRSPQDFKWKECLDVTLMKKTSTDLARQNTNIFLVELLNSSLAILCKRCYNR